MTTMVDAASSDIERAEELKTLANEAFKGNCLGFRMQIYDVQKVFNGFIAITN